MNSIAPIVLFAFNRPEHTKKTIDSLLLNELAHESEIFIFSDGPRLSDGGRNPYDIEKITQVRRYLNKVEGFRSKNLIFRDENLGLSESVITGVSKVLETHASAIILEDDMVFSKNYLEYMNNGLKTYQERKDVSMVSGYAFPIQLPRFYEKNAYLYFRTSSWGWGTWKDRWESIDWKVSDWEIFRSDRNLQLKFNRGGPDLTQMLHMQMCGKINSWSIRFDYSSIMADSYCLYPAISKVQNIGTDGSGVHFKSASNEYIVSLDSGLNSKVDVDIYPDRHVIRACDEFFSRGESYSRLFLRKLFSNVGFTKIYSILTGK